MGEPAVGGGMFGGCAEVLLILFVLWIVYVICEPRRKRADRDLARSEREKLERWSARLCFRQLLTDAERQERDDAR